MRLVAVVFVVVLVPAPGIRVAPAVGHGMLAALAVVGDSRPKSFVVSRVAGLDRVVDTLVAGHNSVPVARTALAVVDIAVVGIHQVVDRNLAVVAATVRLAFVVPVA